MVSSEAWANLLVWASVAGRGRLLLLGSIAHASLKTAVSDMKLINATIITSYKPNVSFSK